MAWDKKLFPQQINHAILFFVFLTIAGISQALIKGQLGHLHEKLHCCNIALNSWKVNTNKNKCSQWKVPLFGISCPAQLASVQTLPSLKPETGNSLATSSTLTMVLTPFFHFLPAAMWIAMVTTALDHALLESNLNSLAPFQSSFPWLRAWGGRLDRQCQIQASFLVCSPRDSKARPSLLSWQQRFRKEGVLFKQKNELFIPLLAKL